MSIHTRILNRSWTSLTEAAASIAQAWTRRRAVGRLGALDDHMLADIGITRQDVLSVLAEPLFVDPSMKLAERALETRLARHAALRDLMSDEPFARRFAPVPRRPDRHAA